MRRELTTHHATSVGLFKTGSPILPTKGSKLLNKYRDGGNRNPKYRLSDEVATFLKDAQTFGIDKLKEVINRGNEEKELPFFLSIEDGENELPPPLVLDFPKTLVLSDIHLGFHDRTALEAAINYGRKNKADCIILNGDILDMYQLSRFDKTPNKGAIVSEIKLAREFFKILREVFPSAEIYFKKGNHEERFTKYFAANAKEFYGFDDFLLEKIIHCDKFNIRTIEDRQLVSLGKLNIYHGHEIGGGGVHVAAGLVTKTNANILCGHWHKTQTYTKTRLNEQPIAGFAAGCLCKLNPYYLPNNQWNHGFAFVDTATDGTFHVHNKRIINGQAV